MHATGIFTKFDGAKKASNQQNYAPSYSPGQGVFENVLCFVSVAQTTCVTCVYMVCGRHKQNHLRSFGKTASIDKHIITVIS